MGSRETVLAFLLGRGTETLTIQGMIRSRVAAVGKKVKPRLVEITFGTSSKEVRAILAAFVREGLVDQGGRGMHAAWWLTEAGVQEAERLKRERAVAVAETTP